MKRILIIFLILIGAYFLLTVNLSSFLPFAKGETEVKLANRIDTIKINVGSVKTNIIPEKRNTVEADLNGKGSVEIKSSGDTITIDFKRNWLSGISFLNFNSELNIYIPENFDRMIDINIGSGYLTFIGKSEKDLMKLDKLAIDMSSGKTDIKNLKVDEYVLDGSSGMISIDNLVTKTGTIDMSSGYISIKNYEGQLNAEVSSGKLDVQVNKLTDDIELQASSGQIKVDLPDDANFTLQGHYSSGLIRSKFALNDQIQEKNRLEGVSGTGKHLVKVTVSSGMVEIY